MSDNNREESALYFDRVTAFLSDATAKKLLYSQSGEPIFYFDKDGNFVIPAKQVTHLFSIAKVIAGYAKQQLQE